MSSNSELHVDANGKTLLDYPRPSMAVDTALVTVHDGELKVLLVRTPSSGWALPGTFLHPGERLADAVPCVLREKAGITGRSPHQLHVFDDPARDERGWVLSVAHMDMISIAALGGTRLANNLETKLWPVAEPFETPLPYDHALIIDYAVAHVRDQYRVAPDPGQLLSAPFTLKDLREIHESVHGEKLQRDTFRRTMESKLVATGEMSDGTKGRPAALFRVYSE
ncbi:NrtR DNA-binding winged helix domain-containing protein [Arthrobacter psychrolactophilus]